MLQPIDICTRCLLRPDFRVFNFVSQSIKYVYFEQFSQFQVTFATNQNFVVQKLLKNCKCCFIVPICFTKIIFVGHCVVELFILLLFYVIQLALYIRNLIFFGIKYCKIIQIIFFKLDLMVPIILYMTNNCYIQLSGLQLIPNQKY